MVEVHDDIGVELAIAAVNDGLEKLKIVMVEIDVHHRILGEILLKSIVQHLFVSLESVQEEKYLLLGTRDEISFVGNGFYNSSPFQFTITFKYGIPRKS
jgi:hypothetical protein